MRLTQIEKIPHPTPCLVQICTFVLDIERSQ